MVTWIEWWEVILGLGGKALADLKSNTHRAGFILTNLVSHTY